MKMKFFLCLMLILLSPILTYGSSQKSTAGNSQLIDQQKMGQILNEYLADQSDLLPHVELRFKSISLPHAYRVAKGQLDYQIIPAKPGVIGSQRLTLLTRVDGQIVNNQSIRINLEALADIAVSASTLRRGAVLATDDVELRYQDISHLKGPIFSTEEIIGKRLKRSVRLGEPLQKQQVEFPPVIKRGERVIIQVQKHGLMLTAAGEAKQDGLTGESIRVVNNGSRKEVICQVVAPGLVKVEF
jgi:flagella basal body P-ring formation protein FlgA